MSLADALEANAKPAERGEMDWSRLPTVEMSNQGVLNVDRSLLGEGDARFERLFGNPKRPAIGAEFNAPLGGGASIGVGAGMVRTDRGGGPTPWSAHVRFKKNF